MADWRWKRKRRFSKAESSSHGMWSRLQWTADSRKNIFYRTEKKDSGETAPFKPLALLNYPMIDEKLGQAARGNPRFAPRKIWRKELRDEGIKLKS